MRFVKTVENLFGLPAGFIRVEYLESTGTQYIDTGYKPIPATTKFEFMFQPDNISGNSFLFGCRPDTGIGSFSCTTYFATGSVRQDWAGLNTYFPTTNINTKYLYTAYDNSISLNTNSVTGTTARSTTRLNFNFLLCAVNTNGTADDRRFIGKIYFSRLWDNGVLVRDFIPCIDPLGVPCMYDLVGKKPYYNQGTGDFTVGRQIIPVEYLEGTGTQYIDTGVRGFADFEIGVKLRESVSNVSIFCGNGYRLERYNASNPYWRFRNNNDFYNSSVSITEYHVMAWKNDEIYADGVKLQDFAKTWSVPANMTLFGASASSSYPSMIYFCKLWNPTDGTLLRDYIPCKDENDNGFLFDKVSGGCYLNNGTGSFAFGENKYKTKLRLIREVGSIPPGCTEVEYLETTNQQNDDVSTNNASYIDTGVLPDNTTKIECRVQFTTLISGNNREALFGTTGVNSSRPARMAFGFASVSPYTNFYMGLGTQNLTTSVTRDTNAHIFTIDASTSSWKIDDTTGTFSNPGEVVGDGTIYLFARNYAAYEYANKPANARTYYCKIWKGGSLVRDMIPVLDWNYTPCMYDKVTEQLFYSQGTGNFTAGREIHPVDYLESTGTQYINLNYIPTDTSGYKMGQVIPTSNGRDNIIIGCRQATNSDSRFWQDIDWSTANRTIGWGFGGYSPKGQRYSVVDKAGTYVVTSLNYMNDRAGKVDDVSYDTSLESKTLPEISRPMYLFAGNNGGTAGYFVSTKIYFVQITEGNKIVRDYIPAIDENGVGFMFDRVSHTCYLNNGTGSFISGRPACKVRFIQDVVPREYAIVNYLESTGTQYIDTGVECTGDLVVQFKGSCSTNVNAAACGGLMATPRFRHHWSPYNARFSYWMQADSYDSASIKPEIFSLNTVFETFVDPVNGVAKINGETYTFTPVSSDKTTGKSYGIFARIAADGAIQSRPCTFYYFKLSRNNTLVRNFIPVVRRIDKVAGMWDTVTKQFFTTPVGAFNYG